MKKRIIFIVAAALSLAVIIGVIAFAVTSRKDGERPTDDTQSGTLTGTEHLAHDSEDTTVLFPETDKSETETDEPTELPTEPPTEPVTEPPTEAPTETETESETEPPTSLKFYSYGNGTCAVAGIGDYKDIYVIIPEKSPSGDIVTAIDDKAFYDNTKIKAVQIPSTVMSIGDMAFSGCTSLVYISVSENNKSFTEINGVLYSKDKTKLILFPSANPATEIMISVNVTEIANMAFASSPNLKQINYGGTLRDWGLIKIGSGNYGIYSAAMTFAVTQ